MTVQELISQLMELPPDATVFIYLDKLGLPLTIDQVLYIDEGQIHLVSEE